MNTIVIGIAGGTGSGKTTLIDLVARFYDATEGSVHLFGRDVKQIGRASCRERV